MKYTNSEALFEQACCLMPGGVNSPVRAFGAVGMTPRFIEKAKGSKIYDADGNEYIDFVGSWGPMILGHAREEVVEAVCQAARQGTSYGAPTRGEVELAQHIIDAVPCAEMVRLVNSGTEAVMSAVRAARGYTGRDLIVKFEGCYHGHSDGLLVKAGSGLLTENVPTSAGVPAAFAATTLTADYNDEKSVREIFAQYGNNIAALIVEPVAANMGVVPPKPGFLQFLRTITRQYGTVLIFDEVITGFRLALGGAQEYYGVTPDMATLGKIIGGGMPMAAYCGRKEIMSMVSPQGPVYQAGTLSGNPAAVAAGLATIKILEAHPEIYKSIEEKGAALEEAYRKAGENYGLEFCMNRAGSLLSVFFTHGPVETYKDVARSDLAKFRTYFASMLESGIYIAPSQFEAMFVGGAHDESDLQKTAAAIDRAFAAVAEG
ncbi:MAG TPA: glutamate-1-semialdehyde 2,1-aminomutase [Candidatus Scybalocola faecigallinarum]|uniref:Glutamate-1-semialdehyde 2,1-aminomutase n=1 Tax=Candidatus Scybalocola faecigallinarum TaxID=2840941 RepID=A0A9D1F707_9FIRM|nr:glutamate-1-semialdehyde 2,1-aminomutase [Candidatus Scybalocola faecigallinarum]